MWKAFDVRYVKLHAAQMAYDGCGSDGERPDHTFRLIVIASASITRARKVCVRVVCLEQVQSRTNILCGNIGLWKVVMIMCPPYCWNRHIVSMQILPALRCICEPPSRGAYIHTTTSGNLQHNSTKHIRIDKHIVSGRVRIFPGQSTECVICQHENFHRCRHDLNVQPRIS